jgi:nucleoid-associated protein YgaU
MFASRLFLPGVVLLVTLVVALWAARPTNGAAPEARYVVKSGDTLWQIAEQRYQGDPREGVWRIRERNDLASSSAIQPGDVLVLP